MKLKTWAILLTAVLANIGTAHAVPTLWVDEFDPGDVFLSASDASSRSHSFALDIRDDFEGTPGFRPGIDSIFSATLFVWLYDDFDLSGEQVSFRFDGGGWSRPVDVDGLAFLPDIFEFAPLAQLVDGILNVSLTATRGDFYFDRAFLTAFGERNEVAVPEPSTLAMLGLGLLAFVGWRRRNHTGKFAKASEK